MVRRNHEDRHGLRERVREEAENRPGIYRFTGPRRELLYVGKSVRVRTRLLSYFRAREGKPRELLRVASGVEWEYVPNEFEALLREFRLIRAFRPRFNVVHRRHRRYAWIRVTREAAPRLMATRSPRPDGVRFLGPFPATRSLPRTLQELSALVGLRDCPRSTPIHFADQLDLLATPRAPLCPRAELGSCPAPCAAGCSRSAYLEGVERALAFLEGRSDLPLDRLRERMERAADRLGFETAARLRDREARLRELRDRVVASRREFRELTFVYPVPGAGTEPRRLYLLREGRVSLTLDEPALDDPGGRDAAAEALRAGMAKAAPTAEQLSESEREELFLVARWFRTHPEERARGVPVESYLSEPGVEAGPISSAPSPG
jgi:excinuclease ABC subunit C